MYKTPSAAPLKPSVSQEPEQEFRADSGPREGPAPFKQPESGSSADAKVASARLLWAAYLELEAAAEQRGFARGSGQKLGGPSKRQSRVNLLALAKACGMHGVALHRLSPEKPPDVATLIRIANVLGLKPKLSFEGT